MYIQIHSGPAPVPQGTHSWGFDFDPGDAGGPVGFPSSMTMSQITVASAWFHATQVEEGRAWAFYQEPADEGTAKFWVGKATLNLPANTWTEFSLPGLTYSWTKYDTSTSPWPVLGTAAASGVAAFVDAHGDSGYGGYAPTMGCNGNAFSYDKFSIGSSGNVTVYDFEELLTTTKMLTTGTTMLAGNPVTIKGTLSPLFPGAPVRLEQKKFGSTQWTLVGTANSTDSGALSKVVKPLKQTSYRWVYAGSDVSKPSTSASVIIKVKTKMTALRSVSAVNVRGSFTVKGRSTPAKPGFTATLWRKTANGPVKLKTATIKLDDTYAFSVKPGKAGKWTMYVTVPAGAGNLAGTSPTTSVSVVN